MNLLKMGNGKFAHGKIFFQASSDGSFLDDFTDVQVPILEKEYAFHLETIVDNIIKKNVIEWNNFFSYHFRDDCFYQYNYYEISKYLFR